MKRRAALRLVTSVITLILHYALHFQVSPPQGHFQGLASEEGREGFGRMYTEEKKKTVKTNMAVKRRQTQTHGCVGLCTEKGEDAPHPVAMC